MHAALYTPISICGEVTAGRPTTNEEIEPGCIAVDLSTIGISQNTRTFALRVRGDSMIGAHILDGDTIVLIGEGGKKFMKKVALGRMHFDGIETEPVGAAGRRRKRFTDASRTALVEGERRGFFRVVGNERRSDDLPCASIRRRTVRRAIGT